jgi:hypothetical protein
MTTFTFVPSPSAMTVDWNTPSIWAGGVVPNGSDADVVIPVTTVVAPLASPYVSNITMSGTFRLHSLSIAENYLTLNGALTIEDALKLATGGDVTLDANASLAIASCSNDGSLGGVGQITCSGAFLNTGQVRGTGLTLTAASLDNTGELYAEAGVMTVDVTPGGFSNLTGTTLTGGTYSAYSGTLDMNVGGVVTVDAANIILTSGGEVSFWDNTKGAYVPIETTLQAVAASGSLSLGDGASWGALTVDGQLGLDRAATFTQLTIDPGGKVSSSGAHGAAISGALTDNGTITFGSKSAGGSLDLTGPITGSGTIEIVSSDAMTMPVFNGPYFKGCVLEVGAACSASVVFDGSYGTLFLDDPRDFTGRIAPAGGVGSFGYQQGDGGDEIVLRGIDYSKVRGFSYSGDRTGGTLEIDLSDGSHLDLNFSGDFTARNFGLGAGPQLLSSDPPSLEILNLGPATPAPDFLRDHFNGGSVSDILISNTNGAVVVGEVSGGQESYTAVAGLGPEWSFRGTGDFLGDGKSSFLVENAGGFVDVAEVANGKTTYSEVAALGPEWKFVGTGDFWGLNQGVLIGMSPYWYTTGGSQDQFLIENASGQLDLGTVLYGQTSSVMTAYRQIDQLSPDWKVLGAGAFLGDGTTQFLKENSAGLVEIGAVQTAIVGNQTQTVTTAYTQVAALGPEWTYVASGDVLGDGRAQFLIENAAGVLVAAEVGADGKAHYTTLAGLGPEWTIEGVGDYLGEGVREQVVMKNTSGAVVIGDWSGGQVHWSHVGQLGSEWSFHA